MSFLMGGLELLKCSFLLIGIICYILFGELIRKFFKV